MIPSFQDLQAEMLKLKYAEQELISSVYRIIPSTLNPDYEFACYYDKQTDAMNFGLLFGQIEVKMFDSIPSEIVVEYAEFIKLVKAYEEGADFPYSVAVSLQDEPEYNLTSIDGE